MQRIDSGSQVATMPEAPAEDSPGFFKDGVLGEGSGTVVDAGFMNSVQEEICGFIESRGIGLSRSAYNQLRLAIEDIVATAISAATTTNAGVVELADDDEVRAGTDTTRAVTPSAFRLNVNLNPTKGHIEIPGLNWLIQWIKATGVGDEDELVFSTPFASTNFAIAHATYYFTHSYVSFNAVDAQTIRVQAGGTHDIDIIALGPAPTP